MKKIFYSFIILFILFSGKIYAQSPNNDFEDWTNVGAYDSASYWSTPDFFVATCASKEATDVWSGAFAMKLVTSSFSGFAIPGAASTGSFIQSGFSIDLSKGGQPDVVRHALLRGYYKYSPAGTAAGSIEVVLYKRNGSSRDTIASAIMPLGLTLAYTPFSIPLVYKSGGDPDSSIVYFQSSGRTFGDLTTAGTLGSALLVDSVYFDGITGIEDIHSDLVSINSYPNPATDFLVIETKWSKPVSGTIAIVDINGKLIQSSPILNDKQRIDVSSLSNGNYFYRFNNESGQQLGSGKFSVRK